MRGRRRGAPAAGSAAATLVVVLGTGTEVGKTWVTAALARRVRDAGVVVSARKPAQSFAVDEPPGRRDAAVLGEAVGEAPEAVCPPHRWYPEALAPPMAAEALGRPVPTVAELVAELVWPADVAGTPGTLGLVETAGGVRSPLGAPDAGGSGDALELVGRLAPDHLLLVAPAELGSINAVRLASAAAGALAPAVPLTVVLTRYDEGSDLHRRTHRWLAQRDGLDVVALPGAEAALARRLGF